MERERAGQWLGAVRIARPISFSVVTVASLLILTLIVAFISCAEVTRKARLTGIVVPIGGTLNIAAPQGGVIQELLVTEGQIVKQGAAIMILNIGRSSISENHAQNASTVIGDQIRFRQKSIAAEQELSSMRARQQQKALTTRAQAIDLELGQLATEVALKQKHVKLSEESLARTQKLVEAGYLSELQLQVKQEELIDVTSQLNAAVRTQLSLAREKQGCLDEIDHLQLTLKSDLNTLSANFSSLEQQAAENAVQGSIVLTAPYEAQISGINIKAGQSVNAGQNLATLLRSNDAGMDLEANLFAPSSMVGFIQPDQQVFVRYAAYPYQKYGMYKGRIASISGTPFSVNELPGNLAQQIASQAGTSEVLYRITVELHDKEITAHGETHSIKPGFSLDADVMQERRRIWEIIFEPLLIARQQVQTL